MVRDSEIRKRTKARCKLRRSNRLKQLWQEDQTAINAWLTIPSAWTAEILAHVGFDALTIDMQHGLADFATAVSMLQAISTTNAVPLVRVPWNEPISIMRMLDAGAYGIIAPMINTRPEAEAFVRACRYPPAGYRSYGPIRANLNDDPDYIALADQGVVTLAMIETQEALKNLDDILATESLDGIYLGLADMRLSLGSRESGRTAGPPIGEILDDVLGKASSFHRVVGIHADSPETVAALSEVGFRLVTPVNDSTSLRSSARQTVQQARAQLARSNSG